MGSGAYFAMRTMVCSIFLAAGLFKVFHFDGWAGKIAHFELPMARQLAFLAMVFEIAGGLMMVAGVQVSAAAALFVLYTVYGTYLEHRHVIDADGAIVFPEYAQVFKNVSIVGGLCAVIALDPAPPGWLAAVFGH